MVTNIDDIRIHANGKNEALDRRIKLTENDRVSIYNQYFDASISNRPTMTWLAETYSVDRRLIQFILFPEREERHKLLAKERRKDGRYYDKEKGRVYMQEHREYKRELVRTGKL